MAEQGGHAGLAVVQLHASPTIHCRIQKHHVSLGLNMNDSMFYDVILLMKYTTGSKVVPTEHPFSGTKAFVLAAFDHFAGFHKYIIMFLV